MCGIIGYIGPRDGVEIVRDGLRRLEYRGYDSAGISVVDDGALHSLRSVGKLAALEAKFAESPLHGQPAIGHTRWATHGVPSEANAHPHHDDSLSIAVVHNGIIENYLELGAELRGRGVVFRSETDTEIIAHLIRRYYEGDLFAAVKHALGDVRGAYALGVICKDNPEVLIAARSGSPLVVGLGDGENYIASDAAPLLPHTREVLYLEDGHVCEIRRDGYTVHDIDGNPQSIEPHTVDWDESMAEKGGYPHFMLKEINEQPEVLRNTLRGRINLETGDVLFEDLDLSSDMLAQCPRILIVACGTAWHAGLIGKRLIESYARIPVDVEIASEFRYRDLLIPEGALVIPITQSGETADTLEALRIAKRHGAKILSLANVVGATIPRESDGVIYLRAGIEIGVASTKAYTAMIAALTLLAVHLGRARNTLDATAAKALLRDLIDIPDKMQTCLDDQSVLLRCAADERFRDAHSAFFLGRGYNLPTACEGALKLKEISYVHAEAYGAGEMKHGAIALVTDKLPCIFIAPKSETHAKIISNMQEVRARQGVILAIATEGDTAIAPHADEVIYIPDCPEALSPLLATVPLQLLAYHISVNRGCDVDQPRNLAKSVTVE